MKATLLWLRRCVAICVFALFLLLFSGLTEAARHASLLAAWQIGPALLAGSFLLLAILALAALLFGRLYCSLLCPFGLLQDIISALPKNRRYQPLPAMKGLRLTLLALFAVCLAAGIALPYALLDPYSAFGRIMTDLISPLALAANNFLAWSGEKLGLPLSEPQAINFPGIATAAVAISTLLLITALAYKYGRLWCNLCPVGTALGLLAKKSFFRIRLNSDKCVSCGLCQRVCKTGCIAIARQEVDNSRCVDCFCCEAACPKGAIAYGPPEKTAARSPNPARRAFLHTAIAGAALGCAIPQKVAAAGYDVINRPDKLPVRRERRPREIAITPPGSDSLDHFARHCTGCQLCVSACPNNVLATGKSGSGLLQPGLSYELGYCRPNCRICGEVCPAGAIRPFTLAQKKTIQIGTARVDFQKCIVHTDKVQCTACFRICPSEVISLIPVEGSQTDLKRPQVDAAKCIGCGACEYICPAMPIAAITVTGKGAHAIL